MTSTDLENLFRAQLNKGAVKVFYMKQQDNSDTISVLSHDTAASTFNDLLTSLVGFKYSRLVSERNWPVFIKETA